MRRTQGECSGVEGEESALAGEKKLEDVGENGEERKVHRNEGINMAGGVT